MIEIIATYLKRGAVTTSYPKVPEPAPENFRGKPIVDAGKCDACGKCVDACPSNSISLNRKELVVCVGSCVFCGACSEVCPKNAISQSPDFELSSKNKNGLYDRYKVGLE